MSALALAEIVEEGRNAFAARRHEAPFVTDAWRMWLLINGPRLLAVAAAVVEWDKAEDDNLAPHPDEVCDMGPGDCAACAAVERRFQRVLVARTALHAAIRGAKP